ncbi:hypothetical protein [Porphyrobacter sp. GA68]|uniref:hypothetical protein n=1 Tax=Porphyrobacter sp. GA68 TaxID=2883480 RepID=UPI001D18A384|nr:hypothetical protein [Porphyrobacter sp. GA68]
MTRYRWPMALLLATLPLPLAAQEPADRAANADRWSGQVTIYAWGAGVGGDFTPFTGGPTLSFDKALGEVLKDLDAAFFATGLARNGDLVLLTDLTYTKSSKDGLLPPGIPAAGEVSIRSLSLLGGKRFQASDATTIDVLGGIRAWSLDGKVNVPLAGLALAPKESFVDPVAAVRLNSRIAPRLSFLAYGDVGGFGIGSDLTWQGVATLNYQASNAVYLSAGYRHLYLDRQSGGASFAGSLSGPLAGVTLAF